MIANGKTDNPEGGQDGGEMLRDEEQN